MAYVDESRDSGAPMGRGAAGPALAPADDRTHPADDRMDEALKVAAVQAEETGGLGRPGRPVDKRSPFFIGMTAAAGVAVTYGLVELVITARAVLVLIGLALFIAIGLDPVVAWLTRRRVPRWAAVVAIVLAGVGIVAGFVMAAVPPLVAQTKLLAAHFPQYVHALESHDSALGRLNARFHVQQQLTHLLSSKGTSLAGGVLGAGEFVLSAASSAVILLVLVIYFLADLPRIKLFAYRLAPHTRRARVILIGDEILRKVGGFLLGNLLTSVIAGIGTYLWMIAWGIPYPLLLGLLIALVALSVSLPVAIATLCFYVGYRLAEDYLLVPRVMGKTVQVPGMVSVVAVLVGGTLMGLVGALIAIPAAAALRLLLHEVAFRRLDRS
jgi:predicted PurR-regulated permease PerM